VDTSARFARFCATNWAFFVDRSGERAKGADPDGLWEHQGEAAEGGWSVVMGWVTVRASVIKSLGVFFFSFGPAGVATS
jgi:hypothetical protein